VLLTAPKFRKYNTQTIFLDFGFFFQFFKPGVFAAGKRGFVGLFTEAIRLGTSGHQLFRAL
jgi:hypothetical protein